MYYGSQMKIKERPNQSAERRKSNDIECWKTIWSRINNFKIKRTGERRIEERGAKIDRSRFRAVLWRALEEKPLSLVDWNPARSGNHPRSPSDSFFFFLFWFVLWLFLYLYAISFSFLFVLLLSLPRLLLYNADRASSSRETGEGI